MRVAHFDCFSGASGDMLLGALVDAGFEPREIGYSLSSLGVPFTLEIEKVKRAGLMALQVKVVMPPEKAHRHLKQVNEIIDKARLSDKQRALAKSFFVKLAEAKAQAHGIPVEKVHFHEVGAIDSIADFVGAAIGLDRLGVDKFTCRSIPTGSGTVECEHGTMPVPAPATAILLKGVPLASSDVQAELTTPTGAAILTTIVNEWTDSPAMTIERIGNGAGSRDFPKHPNILRLLVGTAADAPNPDTADYVWLMETNLDDVPGEIVGYTLERLFTAGALDAWTTAIQMKKNRPGVLLSVLADDSKLRDLEAILFAETGTLGVRRRRLERTKQPREEKSVETEWGPVRVKAGKPEFEDCARIAREKSIPLSDVLKAIQKI